MLAHAAATLRPYWEHYYPIVIRGDSIPVVAACFIVLLFVARSIDARRSSAPGASQ